MAARLRRLPRLVMAAGGGYKWTHSSFIFFHDVEQLRSVQGVIADKACIFLFVVILGPRRAHV